MGPKFTGELHCIESHNDSVYVASVEGKVYLLDRSKIKAVFEVPEKEKVVSMKVVGENMLVLTQSSLLVLSLSLSKICRSLKFEKIASCFFHPHTYLNKVVVGFNDGSLELWNFSTEKLIYTYNSSHNSSIKSLAQTPVVDIVAVGFDDGYVVVKDLKQDTSIFEVKVKSSVTDITFRSDAASQSRPQMAVASCDGLINVWNLESKTIDASIRAHESAVTSVFFLPGQPILISAGKDNSIKEWVFEEAEVRLLRSRAGHTAPPNIVRFVGNDGFSIVSAGGAGDQSLRVNSLLKDSQTHELSQGSLESKAKKLSVCVSDLRLPAITKLASFVTKDLRWDNLLTAHEGSSSARTWRIDNKALGKHTFTVPSVVTAVCISPCGNFGIVGTEAGTVDVFNMQSGLHRRSFKCEGSIIGLAVDQFNRELITVTASGHLDIWDFNKVNQILFSELFNARLSTFAFLLDNGLVAVSDLDDILSIFDIEARRVVRRLSGHKGQIVDLSFSTDGKWLISASTDRSIRTWDLPSGLVLDSLLVDTCPKSISFSPTAEFLAVAFENDPAIHLYSNRSLTSSIRLDLQHSFPLTNLPSTNIQDDIIVLSNQPRSKWLSLFHLDEVKARNKPHLPDGGPKLAPFFLDAMVIDDKSTAKRSHEDEAIARNDVLDLALPKLLEEDDSSKILQYLLEAGSSQVQFEISSLPQSCALLSKFFDFLTNQLLSKANYELIQTYINISLKSHQEFIRENFNEFSGILERLEEAERITWERMESLLNQSLCLTSFCRDLF